MQPPIAMLDKFYHSAYGLSIIEEGPRLFTSDLRHSAAKVTEDHLYVFGTRASDASESIPLSTIDLTTNWENWIKPKELALINLRLIGKDLW